MTRENVRSGSALIGEGGERIGVAAASNANPGVAADAAMSALRDRGISNPEGLLQHASPDAVLETCRWYDQQQGRVGTGVLVNEIRSGGRKPAAKKNDPSLSRQKAYEHVLRDTLAEHFPDLMRPVWGPHPAAVTALIHLHYREGKQVDVRRFAGEIRKAVKAWNAEHGDPMEGTETTTREGK